MAPSLLLFAGRTSGRLCGCSFAGNFFFPFSYHSDITLRGGKRYE